MATNAPSFSCASGYSPAALAQRPDADTIVEPPLLDDAEAARVVELRAEVLRRIDANGGRIAPTSGFHTPVKGHWRDTYDKHAHLTQCKASAPSLAPIDADPRNVSPSTQPSAWSDLLLARFLRARKQDVHKAANMFLNYLHFRESYGVDDLARQSPMPFDDIITSIIGHRIHGVDKRGYPVYFQRTGKINGSEFVRRVPDDVLILTHVHFVESMAASLEHASRKLGHRMYKSVTVLDLTGLSLPLARTLKFFRLTSFIDQHYYPEMLGALYMANAPMIFHHMYASAKLFLDPVTQAKIHVLGTRHTRSTLVNDLGADCLPVEFGGTCACSPECLPSAQMAGSDAGSMAEVEAIEKSAGASAFQTVQVGAGRAHEVELIVPSSGGVVETSTVGSSTTSSSSADSSAALPDTECVVWWSFEITAKDIDFSVTLHAPNDPAPVELVPVTRLAVRAQQPYRGLQALNGVPGARVVLRWSNAYSMFTGKEVRVAAGLHQRQVVNELADSISQLSVSASDEDGEEEQASKA